MYRDTGNIGDRIRKAKTNITQKTKVMSNTDHEKTDSVADPGVH
jgi:hypothetical protein